MAHTQMDKQLEMDGIAETSVEKNISKFLLEILMYKDKHFNKIIVFIF